MRTRLLGPTGVKVSALSLGTMSFGGDADEATAGALYGRARDAGVDFFDTADVYNGGRSEEILGRLMRDHRDQLVIASKAYFPMGKGANDRGSSRYHLVRAVEASLRRLATDRIDVYYLHRFDDVTDLGESLRALDDLVRAGKALHVGISDTPAWVIAKANAIADLRGWSRFVALQAEYSLLQRTAERELLPMAHDSDMAVLAFAVLEGGELTGKYNRATAEPKRNDQASERGKALADTLIGLASELGRTPAQVAINWVRQQSGAPIIPILGARTAAQLRDNLGCLEFELTAEQIARLADASPLELGFPHYFLALPHLRNLIYSGMFEQIDNHRI
jgi:aryl-alcohol dehydrogenase-like predicted oxidoreductase